MRIPRAAGFALTSPAFSAPTRYFDSVIVRYSTPLEGLRARVVWSYEQAGDFSDDLSVVVPIAKAPAPAIAQIRLNQNSKWDGTKTILRLKMLIEGPSGTVAEASTGAGTTSSDQFTINYMVFDRDAFSDTFERPTTAK
jgi:hypothetical protein